MFKPLEHVLLKRAACVNNPGSQLKLFKLSRRFEQGFRVF